MAKRLVSVDENYKFPKPLEDRLEGMVSKPGPPGAGVPEGGAPLQVIRKTSAGNTTEWVTPTKGMVGLSQVDDTSDKDKPISVAQGGALATKADLVDGKVPAGQLNLAALTPSNSARPVGQGELFINAKDYGAKGDGVADDTASLNAAAAAAFAQGPLTRLFIPSGIYRISGTVTITCELDATQATFHYYGTGTAVVLGSDASGVSTARVKFAAPRVINKSRTTGWDGTSIGIKAVNLNAGDLYIPFVQDFEKGLVLFGKGAGITYMTITIGALWDNHKNLVLDSDPAGYSNQMVIIGGRINQTMSKGATIDDVNANQISMVGESGGPPAGNILFLNTCVETNGVAYHLVDMNGRYNQFLNVRWEVPGGMTPRIKYGPGAQYNKIIGGYDAEKLVETFTFPGLGGGTIEDGLGAYAVATSTAGQPIPHNAWAAVTSWDQPSTRRVTYDAATGNFKPRAGRWRITATVTLSAGQATKFQARIIANGGAADIDEKPGSTTGRSVLKLSTVRVFDGTGIFRIEALQVQGSGMGAQGLETAAAYVNINAEYLGA